MLQTKMTAAALTANQLVNMADTDFDTSIKDMSTKVNNSCNKSDNDLMKKFADCLTKILSQMLH